MRDLYPESLSNTPHQDDARVLYFNAERGRVSGRGFRELSDLVFEMEFLFVVRQGKGYPLVGRQGKGYPLVSRQGKGYPLVSGQGKEYPLVDGQGKEYPLVDGQGKEYIAHKEVENDLPVSEKHLNFAKQEPVETEVEFLEINQ